MPQVPETLRSVELLSDGTVVGTLANNSTILLYPLSVGTAGYVQLKHATAGLFDSDSGLRFDKATGKLTVANSVEITASQLNVIGNARCKGFSTLSNVNTTDTSVTTIYSFTPTDEACTLVTAESVMVKSDGTKTGAFVRRARVKRDGGTVTISAVEATYDSTEFSGAGAPLDIDVSGTSVRTRVKCVESATTCDHGNVTTLLAVSHA